jgi:hypothetical protein
MVGLYRFLALGFPHFFIFVPYPARSLAQLGFFAQALLAPGRGLALLGIQRIPSILNPRQLEAKLDTLW